jgi:hypothetical protein
MQQIKLMIAALFLISPFAANADPIVTTGLCADGVNSCYTSIENLDIQGILYNVDWYTTPVVLSDLLVSDPGVAAFAGDSFLALAAANAINKAFNDAGLNLWTIETGTEGYSGLWIVSDILADNTMDFQVAWSNYDQVNFLSGISISRTGPFAIFARTSVPEPSTLALVGIGLLGLGLTRRRKA